MEKRIVQLRGRGTLTLPSRIRERYGLSDGDPLTVIDFDGAIVLVPKVGIVPKLAAEIERIRTRAGLEVSDLITQPRRHTPATGRRGRR